MKIRKDFATVILTLVAWFLAVGLIVNIVQTSRPVTRDESGSVTEENDANWSDVQVGDCVTSAETETVVTSLTVIPCEQNHKWQIYGIGDSTLTSFVQASLENEANSVCESFWSNIYMEKVNELSFEVEDLYYMPTESSWSKGDRSITCLLGSSTYLVPESLVK